MIVECPSCHTRFNLPEDKASPEAKLKCSRCENVFSLEEGTSQGNQEQPGEQLVQEFDAEEEWKQDRSTEDDLSLDVDVGEKKVNKKLVWTMILILVLIAGGFAAYFLFPGVGGYVQDMTAGKENAKSITSSEKAGESSIENIHLENVRQYFVSNEKIGQVFVIEGKAVNRFEDPKGLIKLRAVLYDDNGEEVQSKDFFCGNNVSLFQLQVSTQEELESSLNARVGVITNNSHIGSDQSTPFMVAFYSPPDEVKEFGLEVIQAKDPAEDDS
ncbi:MAG: DUF3426 domain-containing protein [Desulfonatronovibrionaceae bacterium]